MISTFAIVLLILYLAYFTSRKLGAKAVRTGSSRYIEVLDRVAMGQDCYLAIVKTGGKYLLLGVNQSGVRTLSELEEDKLVPADGGQTTQGSDFKEKLTEILSEKLGRKGGGK